MLVGEEAIAGFGTVGGDAVFATGLGADGEEDCLLLGGGEVGVVLEGTGEVRVGLQGGGGFGEDGEEVGDEAILLFGALEDKARAFRGSLGRVQVEIHGWDRWGAVTAGGPWLAWADGWDCGWLGRGRQVGPAAKH